MVVATTRQLVCVAIAMQRHHCAMANMAVTALTDTANQFMKARLTTMLKSELFLYDSACKLDSYQFYPVNDLTTVLLVILQHQDANM